MNTDKIAVIGLGLMGKGIVHAFASHGFEVVAVRRREEDQRLDRYFETEVERGRLTQSERAEISRKITPTTDIRLTADCGVIVECIYEDPEAKRDLFSRLDRVCAPETIFASNTSSIPIAQLRENTSRRDRFVGIHFMSPVPVMKLVEIVRDSETSVETLGAAVELSKRIGKTPIVVKDSPGFVSSRLFSSYIAEAIHILTQGVSDAESIDTIAKLGMNLPIGPLKLADEIGLDIVLNVMESLHEGLGDSRYLVPQLLRTMVANGCFGKKSGKGFFEYARRSGAQLQVGK